MRIGKLARTRVNNDYFLRRLIEVCACVRESVRVRAKKDRRACVKLENQQGLTACVRSAEGGTLKRK